eukprot:gnl/Ergobibamus_cyprinoides/1433.p1 GENE.gnl/Ergobibamus_cyprinoides/1433~~gnl/Ergobibamus_cyprinoides/1433.p1  ORF type:complete len:329 (+),score=119.48 gnl/Ergobibamus_cyprinoides/1433:145-1131(+)
MDDDWGNVIILQGIPRAPESKVPKQRAVIGKFLVSNNVRVAKNGLVLPVDTVVRGNEEAAMSLGFAFVELEDAPSALKIIGVLEANPTILFGARYPITTIRYTEFMDAVSADDTPPTFDDSDLIEPVHTDSWLLDDRFRSQLMIHDDQAVYTQWYDSVTGLEDSAEIHATKLKGHAFSPLGSYVYAIAEGGVSVFAGDHMEQIWFIEHLDVQWVTFSPEERFVITVSPPTTRRGLFASGTLWDAASSSPGPSTPRERVSEFFVSHDDRFLARVRPRLWSPITPVSGGTLVGNSSGANYRIGKPVSHRLPGVDKFSWSPRRPLVRFIPG